MHGVCLAQQSLFIVLIVYPGKYIHEAGTLLCAKAAEIHIGGGCLSSVVFPMARHRLLWPAIVCFGHPRQHMNF